MHTYVMGFALGLGMYLYVPLSHNRYTKGISIDYIPITDIYIRSK